VQVKTALQVYDIMGEGALLFGLLCIFVIVLRLYRSHKQDRSWLLLMCGLVIVIGGSLLDFMDEFLVLPQILPHGIEKMLGGVGAMVLAVGASGALTYQVRASRTDPSTGRKNRRYFVENLQRRITIAPDDAFSLVFIDVRRWGIVDDMSMRQVGLKLVSITRTNDTVSRFSSTVFALTVPGDEPEGLMRLRNRIIESIEGNECDLICSGVGIASYPKDGKNIDTLLDAIERRMYGPALSSR
jgi:GGDEF domain-containing protein